MRKRNSRAKGLVVMISAAWMLAGCYMFSSKPGEATVVDATDKQVVIRQTWGTPESSRPAADAACKKRNPESTAVFKTITYEATTRSLVFDCQK